MPCLRDRQSEIYEYRRDGRHLMDRRGFLQLIGATGAAALTASCNRISSAVRTPSSPANLVRFPEKAEMIFLTDRPPQLETPIHYFRQDLTPNEAFFVRWHLEGMSINVPAILAVSSSLAFPAASGRMAQSATPNGRAFP